MDKAVLVDFDVKAGAQVVEMLDRTKVRVSVALWAFLPEYQDWRLVLAGRPFDTRSQFEAYDLVHDTLSAAGIRPSKTPPLMILRMADPFIAALRRSIGKTEDDEGMRISAT
jgi:hypothetical protein